jgi:hypothetical protein
MRPRRVTNERKPFVVGDSSPLTAMNRLLRTYLQRRVYAGKSYSQSLVRPGKRD